MKDLEEKLEENTFRQRSVVWSSVLVKLLIDFSDRVLGEEGEATTTDVKHISDLEQDVNR